jgi:phage terminase large subunit-like protein
MDAWDSCAIGIDSVELEGRECMGGRDLATTTDLTALVLLFPDEEGGFDVLPISECLRTTSASAQV